jgi:alpha-galactosidase
VEVPCIVNANGITPTYVGELPLQLAAMNSLNIYVQLLTIEAAVTGKMELVYQAAMLEPHTAATLSTDEVVAMCDELAEAHKKAGFPIL